MSIDISLYIDTGGSDFHKVTDVGNYPGNLNPIWARALSFELGRLHDQYASDCIFFLRRAIAHMENNRAEYETLGNYCWALAGLRTFLKACIKHPKTIVKIY